MGESSDEDDKDQFPESHEQMVDLTFSDENEAEASDLNQSQRTSDNESAYHIYRPPVYVLPPSQDPKLSALDLREQIKIICAYHTKISRSIANQASVQIDSCSYPEPMDPSESNTSKEGNSNQACSSNSEEYVLRSGRITKRKFYAENDETFKVRKTDVLSSPSRSKNKIKDTKNDKSGIMLRILEGSFQEGDSDLKESGDSETLSKKKASLTPTRSKYPRQRQFFSASSEEGDGERRTTIIRNPYAGTSTSTRQQSQKKVTDGFIEPAVPGASKITRKTVQCPICSKYFPIKEVERHASSCGEIPVEVAKVNLNVSGFRCQTCQAVMTTLVEYEIHCALCDAGPSHF